MNAAAGGGGGRGRIGAVAESLANLRVTKLSWPAVFALAIGFVALEALRRPLDFLAPQFYAEDGPLFYAAAREFGFWRPLLTPTEGYLNTFPRLAAAFAQAFPVDAGPLVFTISVLLLRLAPVAYLLSSRAAMLLPSLPARIAVGALYVLLPNAEEVCGGVTNAQWLLTLPAVLILLCAPPAGARGWIADLVLLSLFALTGPMSLVMAPVALLLLLKPDPGAGRTRSRVLAGVLLAGAAVQAACLATGAPTNRLLHGTLSTLEPGDLVRILSGHLVFDNLFGWNRFVAWQHSFGMPGHLAGLVLLAALAGFVLVRREKPLLLLLYLSAATVILSLVFPSNDLALWVNPGFSQRYYFTASLFVTLAALGLAFSRSHLRWLGILWTASTALVAVPGDYRFTGQFDTRFPDQMAVFRSLPPGTDFAFPIYPEGWGMKLRQPPDSVPVANPLAALPQLREAASVSLNRTRLTVPLGLGNERYLQISGRATDPATGGRAGGVVILAGGRMFPAIYGMRRASSSAEIEGPYDTIFMAYVPALAIRSGAEGFSVAVMSADRKSFLRPYGPVFPTP